MTLPNTPMLIPKKSQEAIINYHRSCYTMLASHWNIREQMREIDLQYQREKDLTKNKQDAKVANRYGDTDRLQNLTIPVVYPQVESAVTYQSSVYLTGVPLFGVHSDPANEDAALQMETIIDNNATRGGWIRELILSFRDGFKYNLAFIEVSWARETTATLETDINFAGGKKAKPKNTIWEGNKLTRWDPYNVFFDTRVAPTELYKEGEFVGRTELMSTIKLKDFINKLPDKMVENIRAAFESGFGSQSAPGGVEAYYTPQVNPSALINTDPKASFNWMAWASPMGGNERQIQYKNMYEVTTMYARILPSAFGLKVPEQNTPQIWKFVIVNHQVLIYAERQTNAHNYLPVMVMQPNEDGLRFQTKSLATNVQPIQEISSALMNSVIAARRRAISDRGLYDPSRVNKSDINSANPSAKIPVRPSAYGKPLSESYYPIPFNDDQSTLIMQQLGMLGNYANTISGSNPVRQGQFVKGNKTQHEFESVMANANGRDQLCSMLLEAQFFTPMKEILLTDVLQYQGAGTLYNREKEQKVTIDPIAMRNAVLSFKVSDGLTPTDKLMNSDVMMVAMQQIGTSPQLAAGYNIAPMFSYLMKTQGAKLAAFEKSPQQMAYEQAVAAWSQTVQQMAATNKDIKPEQFPPQPTPQQFGYDPTGNNVASQQQTSQPQPQAAIPQLNTSAGAQQQ